MIAVRGKGWIVGALVIAAIAVLLVATRSGTSKDAEGAADAAPATLTPIKGSDVKQVTRSKEAAARLGIKTAPVTARGAKRMVIPYDAVLYAADGSTFTYTSPKPHVFVRAPISVQNIRGDRAVLSAGPPIGTAVVIVGSQELFGTEYEVEED